MKTLLVERALAVKPLDSLNESNSGPGYFVERSGNGKIILRLPATTLDVRNENGRVYSTQVMEAALRRAESDFKARKLLSTVDDHPSDPYVAPGNASHLVTRAWCENGYLMNEWEVLNTAKGKDLQALVDAKVSFGVSIRGLGSMDNHGNILEDYEYLGTDCVGNPSARIFTAPEVVRENAFQNPNKGTMMKINDPKKYVSEQLRLMQTESDMTARFRRAAEVEANLAENLAGKPAKEVQEVMNAWDQGKESALQLNVESLKEGTKEVQLEAANRQLDALRRQLNTLGRVYREHLVKVTEKNKAQLRRLKEELNTQRINNTKLKGLSRIERNQSRRKLKTIESQLASSRTRNVVLSLKLETAIKEAATSNVARKSLNKKMQEATARYQVAVKEAAVRGVKLKKNSQTPKVGAVESKPHTRRVISEGRIVKVVDGKSSRPRTEGSRRVRDQAQPGFL